MSDYLAIPAATRAGLLRDLDAIDWYRKCLEDKEDHRPVLGFREAKLGYDEAFSRVVRAIEGDASRDVSPDSLPTSRYDWADDPTAQDVVDALRIATLAQDDPAKLAGLTKCLLEFAPETDSSRGIDLLLRLVSEATVKLEINDA